LGELLPGREFLAARLTFLTNRPVAKAQLDPRFNLIVTKIFPKFHLISMSG
jgi:hypothetical protein